MIMGVHISLPDSAVGYEKWDEVTSLFWIVENWKLKRWKHLVEILKILWNILKSFSFWDIILSSINFIYNMDLLFLALGLEPVLLWTYKYLGAIF